MTKSLKNFSGEWLDQIPHDWDQRKIKHLFRIRKVISGELGHHVISITQKGSKVKDIESGEGQLSMDYSKYQFVRTDDFLMNHMDLLTGYIDISDIDGVTSPDYRVFELFDPQCSPSYYLYMFQHFYKSKIFYGYGRGSSQLGRWRLPSVEFENFYVPVPSSFQEQQLISRYLDKKTDQIDSLIEKIQKKIDLLKEQRISLINHCVTKGLDPNVEMKDSEVEWIGEIPEHWKTIPNKRVFYTYFGGSWGDDVDEGQTDNTVQVIRVTEFEMSNLSVKFQIPTLRTLNLPDDSPKLVRKNDLILEKSGGGEKTPVGRIVMVLNQPTHPTVNSNFTNLCRPNTELVDPRFCVYSFSSKYENGETRRNIKQTTGIQNLDIEGFMSEVFVLPPKSEQVKISDFLDSEIFKINLLSEKLENQVHTYKEFRESLISSVVTGKVRVTEDMV